MESQSKTTQTVSALKLLVLKSGEYELWSMRKEQYLTFTDHALFLRLQSEDLNQHLKEFLKCMDLPDLNVENKEKRDSIYFNFPFAHQASNWLEHLPVRSISTLEDLTTRFLAQFFLPEELPNSEMKS
nr:hypothetical protein [Tanacetum cinerariifolium]